MGLLLGLAPLIAFSILTGLSVDLAVWTAFAIAFVISIRDFAQTQVLRVLDVGSTILFGAVALYSGFVQPGLSVEAVHLIVDAGFLVIASSCILSGNPLTLDYVRDQLPRELWRAPQFQRTNMIVSWTWLAAFAAMSAADAAATFSKAFSPILGGAADLAFLTFAVMFTARYSGQLQLQVARARSRRVLRRT